MEVRAGGSANRNTNTYKAPVSVPPPIPTLSLYMPDAVPVAEPTMRKH